MVRQIFKTVKSVLFADPKLLYAEEKEFLNQPFHFQGSNRKGVLLIHGWTSTPYEVRRLGKFLNEEGYTVLAPQLRGHGTVPKDLENVKWTDWLEDVEKSYYKLKKECDEVFVGGTSIGSNLAILLASKIPEISGLVLMATPYQVKSEKVVTNFAKFVNIFKDYNKKFYPPTFGVSTTITRLIAYRSYPIKSALETFDLIKKSRESLEKISQPCFLIQSSSDHVVAKNSLENIFKRIKSAVKKKKYIKRAYHTFISDIKNEGVFEEILEFIKSNENRNLH